MNVRDTTYAAIWNYGNAKNRSQFLAFALLGTGTGYEWLNGERTLDGLANPPYWDGPLYPYEHDQFTLDPDKNWRHEETVKAIYEGNPPEYALAHWAKWAEERDAERSERRDNIDRLVDEREPGYASGMLVQLAAANAVRLWPSTPIFNVPGDVTDDWLSACFEIIDDVLSHPEGVATEDLEWLDEARKDLLARFPGRRIHLEA